MFSAVFVCGVHDDAIPKFICYFEGAFIEALVVWLILTAIWRAVRRSTPS
jgi:hypothetical protein